VEVPEDHSENNVPFRYLLQQNYPNPFNPATTISYSLPKRAVINLNIYDVTGRRIATLADGLHSPGTYQVTFDGSNLSSGIYFVQLQGSMYAATIKMILLK
jgi:hypothetical protein